MQRSKWMLGLVGCFMVVSCGKQVPADIIQPDLMEDILYDYHLSVSMSNNLKSDEYYKRKAYQDYVFQKHQITEAEFDSSMVWYTRHTGELSAIYTKLSERFNKDKQRIDGFLSAREGDGYVPMSGDTVDAWPYRRLYWLMDNPLNNQFAFEIDPDTTYYPKDAFLWKANYTFLTAGKVTMALNVIYENDSVVGQSKLIESSGTDSIYLYTDSAYQVKKINGFIYLSGDSVCKPNVVVNEVSLTKFHILTDSLNEVKDTLDIASKVETEAVKPIERTKRLDKQISIKLQRDLPNE